MLRPTRASIGCLVLLVLAVAVTAQDRRPPTGAELNKLVRRYLEATEGDRAMIRSDCDAIYAPLPNGSALARLRKSVLHAAAKVGPEISLKGTNYFLSESAGKYIARGGGKSLFIGLHGGGVGSGSAESMASGMGGGGWSWIFPEVLHKTGRGWTSTGTEEFVIELIRAAKRTGKIDPNRVYVTGHSMGGYGTWTYAGHHADLFAGSAAYAGAPSANYAAGSVIEVEGIERGILPNLYNVRHFVFQSTDDPRVPPGPNQFAIRLLGELKQAHPQGFDYRYDEVADRGHAAPKEGYLPTQNWVAEHVRDPRPRKVLWQPLLPWKKQFYWVRWETPDPTAVIEVRVAGDNIVEVVQHEGASDLHGLEILVGLPILDPDRELVVRQDGKEVYRGLPERRLSTLLLTMHEHDDGLMFDARVRLP